MLCHGKFRAENPGDHLGHLGLSSKAEVSGSIPFFVCDSVVAVGRALDGLFLAKVRHPPPLAPSPPPKMPALQAK